MSICVCLYYYPYTYLPVTTRFLFVGLGTGPSPIWINAGFAGVGLGAAGGVVIMVTCVAGSLGSAGTPKVRVPRVIHRECIYIVVYQNVCMISFYI